MTFLVGLAAVGGQQVGVVAEKVAAQSLAAAQQLFAVEAAPLEERVHVGALAADLPCQPRRAAPLAAQFAFDDMSYMHRHKRSANLFVKMLIQKRTAPPRTLLHR